MGHKEIEGFLIRFAPGIAKNLERPKLLALLVPPPLAWLPVCLIDKVMQPITFSLLFHQRVKIRNAMSLNLF